MRGVLLGARLRGTADHDGQADQLTAGSGLTFAEIMADIRSWASFTTTAYSDNGPWGSDYGQISIETTPNNLEAGTPVADLL